MCLMARYLITHRASFICIFFWWYLYFIFPPGLIFLQTMLSFYSFKTNIICPIFLVTFNISFRMCSSWGKLVSQYSWPNCVVCVCVKGGAEETLIAVCRHTECQSFREKPGHGTECIEHSNNFSNVPTVWQTADDTKTRFYYHLHLSVLLGNIRKLQTDSALCSALKSTSAATYKYEDHLKICHD